MDAIRLDLTKIMGYEDFQLALPKKGAPVRGIDMMGSFAGILKTSMKQVNEMQRSADTLVQRLALGDVNDISEVSIAVEKSELALRTLSEVRNKLVDAYQQIARMPV